MTEQHRQDHRIDADGLAGARRAGNEQMRHAREIRDDGSPLMDSAERQRQRRGPRSKASASRISRKPTLITPGIRQFDADRIAAGNDGDTDAGALIERAMSSESAMTREAFVPRAGSSS